MLTKERFDALLEYDAETGHFFWRVKRGPRSAGTKAGCVGTGGYVEIRIDGALHYGHRLATLAMTGTHPSGVVDHVNGVRADNTWCNLRQLTTALNNQNQRAPSNVSSTGVLGVFKSTKKAKPYRVAVMLNRVHHHVGYYADINEARAAYTQAKRKLHAGCTI